jgi:diguanylate cyclase (GGDEF)-like protein
MQRSRNGTTQPTDARIRLGKSVKAMAEQEQRPYERFALRLSGLFAVLAAVLTIVAVQVYRTVGNLVDSNDWVNHTQQVKEQVVTTVATLRDAEAAQRAYVIGGDAARLTEAYSALPRLDAHVLRVQELVADNPVQVEDAERLKGELDQRHTLIAQSLATHRNTNLQETVLTRQLAIAREQDARVDQLATRMIARENVLLAQRKASNEATALLTRILTTAAMSLCLCVLAFALFLSLREQKRRIASERRVTASNTDLARSLDESRRLGETLHRLSDLGHMLQGCRTLDEAAEGLRNTMSGLFANAAGAINLMNASQNLIAPICSWGEPIGGEPVFAPDECWALRLGHAYPEEDATAATFTCKHLQDENTGNTLAHLCVPLFAQGATLGTLLLAKATPIERETRDAAVAAAEQISLAIANLRLQETLRTQSLRDALTGLFNRRYLEVSLARDLARAIRRSQPLAVLMLDVDHFKSFNDQQGHDAGDALLAQLGELLAALVRSEDVACRYGGEEFTIVMQETDAALALDRAEDIRRNVAAIKVRHRQQDLGQVTVSIGIASYPQHGDSPDQLLRRADGALYDAKNNGRNRICVADRS